MSILNNPIIEFNATMNNIDDFIMSNIYNELSSLTTTCNLPTLGVGCKRKAGIHNLNTCGFKILMETGVTKESWNDPSIQNPWTDNDLTNLCITCGGDNAKATSIGSGSVECRTDLCDGYTYPPPLCNRGSRIDP